MSPKYDSGFRWYHDSIVWGAVIGVNAGTVYGQFSSAINLPEALLISILTPIPVCVACGWHASWLLSRST